MVNFRTHKLIKDIQMKQLVKYRLPDHFYNQPNLARATLTNSQLRSLMLETSGLIVTHGVFWRIKKQSLGAGVYVITLEEKPRGEKI